MTSPDLCPTCGADLRESIHYDEHQTVGCPLVQERDGEEITVIDGIHTFVWERYDSDSRPDTGWVPRTSYEGGIMRAMERMESICNEQFHAASGDQNAIPDRLLFVQVGGNDQKAVEVRPRPSRVKLEEV